MTSKTKGDIEEDIVPESILSVSKDARYIEQCQELLQQSLAALLERDESLAASRPGGQERKLELQRVRKQMTWMISCFLYILTSTTTGRTLGMEALGLRFFKSSDDFGKTQSDEVSSTRLRSSLFACLSLLVTATVGLASEYFSASDSRATPQNYSLNDNDVSNQQQNRERSRGRERRLIHERLRQQMLERAQNAAGTSASASNQQIPRQVESERNTSQDYDGTAPRKTLRCSASERILSIFRRLTKFMFKVHSNLDGPHHAVQTSNDDEEDNRERIRSTSHSIVFWLLRLHLAHFLWTGRYPTLLHRFLRLEPNREKVINNTTSNPQSRTAIFARPTTNQSIAALILLQASTSLVQNSSNWLAGKVAKYLESRARRNQRIGGQNSNRQLNKTELRATIDYFFGNDLRGPMEKQRAAKLTLRDGDNSSFRMKTKSGDKTSKVLCAICRQERNHSAAPSSCGHVCCWDCLIHWVSKVRPECPFCRAPCSANDILALHDYDPPL